MSGDIIKMYLYIQIAVCWPSKQPTDRRRDRQPDRRTDQP